MFPTHPALAPFAPWRGHAAPGCQVNFLGIQTDVSYVPGTPPTPAGLQQTTHPPLDEEWFEWIDLLECIGSGEGRFVMIELGAGWGRWIANAAVACRRVGRDYDLVGVEAEPTHFRWMREHLARNGIDPTRVEVVNAAVATRPGHVRFLTGSPGVYYQSVAGIRTTLSWIGRRRGWSHRVPAVTLRGLIDDRDSVDLIDLDIQGAEADVLEASVDALRVVKRVHIGTHTREVEGRLRRLFTELGWRCVCDYPGESVTMTPLGQVTFQDGVQTWTAPAR